MTDTPASATGEQIEIRHGEQRAGIVTLGAGLRAYCVGSRAVIDGYDRRQIASSGRGQTLIPWPNRLRDGAYVFRGERYQLPLTEPERANAIHGLVRWEDWSVAERLPDRVSLEYTLHPQEGYPFALAITIEYELGAGGLTVRTSATNIGHRACPYGAGAHPYLTAGPGTIDGCRLHAPGRRWLKTDERMIPTGSAPVHGTRYDFRVGREIGTTVLDTGYTDLERDADGLARVKLSGPDGGGSVTLWQDSRYQYLMLFTGDSLPDVSRRRGGLGVEPMTCAPNAFASGDGLLTLEPGERFTCSWGIEPDPRAAG